MKILQLITGLGQGGAEQVVFDLATRLDRRRHRVTVCSILDVSGEQGVYVGRLKDAGVGVASLGVARKWQLGRAAGLGPLLRDLRPDALHCHMFHANVLGRRMGRRCGVPHIISTVHIAERRWRPWRFWLERKTDPLGDITVCVSQAVLEFQSKKTGLPRGRFTVIPNGIDTARFARPLRPREEVRSELGIPSDAKVVGAIGRLDPQKGYRYLIPAFAQVARESPDAELVIAGDGPERRRIRELADGAGCADRVHLVGRRTDVPDLLHAFDVFVMPSLYEGLPLALIEAMAAGVPVVASAVDSVPEVLGAGAADGRLGRLVPPAQPGKLAEALRDTLDHPDPERTDRARDRARSNFDVRIMVERYAELYDSIGRQTIASHPPST